MNLSCEQDDRRDAVRAMKGRNGLDYIEVMDDQVTLYVYFLGKLPPELQTKKPELVNYFEVTGGRRITDIQIKTVDPVPVADPEKDDYLILTLDKYGDFSRYTLRLTGVENIDPRYQRAPFSFKVNCPSDLDCAPSCDCDPPALEEPSINYLAKDYGSFTQLIFDRMAVLVPDWKERHAADIGVMLVELLAYTGDYLSYHQDAVATEAYLGTARQRISVRRHTRLMDYRMHEGCNARAWVAVGVSADIELDASAVSFITGLNDSLPARQPVLTWDQLEGVPSAAYEVFEPMTPPDSKLSFLEAHNEIRFYAWGERACCLKRGATSATLQDPGRALQLKAGDVLIFEEVKSPTTGLTYDADPTRRRAVRLTKATLSEDPVFPAAGGGATTLVEIEWGLDDALPFPLCLSAVGPAPACAYMEDVSIAHGNIVLVDHGKTVPPEDLGRVPAISTPAACDCVGYAGEVQTVAGRFRPQLTKAPLTYRQALPPDARHPASAVRMTTQDPKAAAGELRLTSDPSKSWRSRYDLIASREGDCDYVVEIDSEGIARLRFGDGELGFQPPAGMAFQANYRVGNGAAGNVGAESISRMVLRNVKVSGVSIAPRNPLPASGGTDAEPVADARMFAPGAFRKKLERAITAADYETLAALNPRLQRASADLVWTGSWYEADVAVDPLRTETPSRRLLKSIERSLEPYRRLGHDLSVTAACYVPIELALEVCVLPDYQRAHVKAELADVFSSRRRHGGKLGYFHPDNLTFGEDVYVSHIVAAAMAVTGVECVTVTALHRLYEAPNQELQNGLLPLANYEIAQLDNDPSFPEHGVLNISVKGGR